VFEDVVYGRVLGAALIGDIARPSLASVSAPTPAIISIHGGCWVGGHKRDTSTIAVTQWAQQFGFFAMSIDYRLASLAAPPACYEDVQCALRYVHANAAQLNVDTSRVFVIGESAGAHLAALCATLGDAVLEKTGGWEEASSAVAAAIAVAGPFELEPEDGVHYVESNQVGTDFDVVYDAYPAPAWRKYWTPRETVDHVWASRAAPHHIDVVAPSEDDAIAARKLASPINHVASGKPPLLILASATDVSAPLPNAERMCAAMEAAGQEYEFEDWPEEGHMQITDRVITRSLRFLQERFAVLDDDARTTAAARL
jgi:acetyl esterase/lipase